MNNADKDNIERSSFFVILCVTCGNGVVRLVVAADGMWPVAFKLAASLFCNSKRTVWRV